MGITAAGCVSFVAYTWITNVSTITNSSSYACLSDFRSYRAKPNARKRTSTAILVNRRSQGYWTYHYPMPSYWTISMSVFWDMRKSSRYLSTTDYGQQRESNWTLTWTPNNSLVRRWCSFFCSDAFIGCFYCSICLDFCNRKIRSMDNFAHVKGTEVRNLLFFGLLPHLGPLLPIEQYAHLALYVCGMRLLHSGDLFGDQTSKIANRLLSRFHEDHERFYVQSQSFKLHLHSHYAALYESHGALSNLGCFGQESFIGAVSTNYHGTRYYGDSICHYFNIDTSIQGKTDDHIARNGPQDESSIPAKTYDAVKSFHRTQCNCEHVNSCCTVYHRFLIHDAMYHCLLYKKRKNSVSYFVRYSLRNDVQDELFGIIDMFFIHKGLGYAVILNHQIKDLCSNGFLDSPYYHLLKKPLDRLYFIVEKDYCQVHVVRTDDISNHCIVVRKNDYLFVSNFLSYNEHDWLIHTLILREFFISLLLSEAVESFSPF